MHSSERKLCYRPDLDGLRAIAILSVVFFHFDFATFGGGFVGVDIFFVISGYLITSIIVSELKLGSFSFARFYERRIRRIVPVLIVVLAVASIAALALFPPNELAQLGLSAAAAAAFCSNIFFAFQTNYFAGPDTMMPLLHTWSLGVEEQFYIVWPLLLFTCYRVGSRLAVSVLVVGLAVVVFLTLSGARRRNMPPSCSTSSNRGRGSSCLAPFWRSDWYRELTIDGCEVGSACSELA